MTVEKHDRADVQIKKVCIKSKPFQMMQNLEDSFFKRKIEFSKDISLKSVSPPLSVDVQLLLLRNLIHERK